MSSEDDRDKTLLKYYAKTIVFDLAYSKQRYRGKQAGNNDVKRFLNQIKFSTIFPGNDGKKNSGCYLNFFGKKNFNNFSRKLIFHDFMNIIFLFHDARMTYGGPHWWKCSQNLISCPKMDEINKDQVLGKFYLKIVSKSKE